MDVRAALAIVFGSYPVPCFLEYPDSVPDQRTIASMTVVTLIQQLISSFGTTFSSTAIILVHQLLSSDMVIPAVYSSIVSPLDTYDIHNGFLCILQDPLFGPHSYFHVS